MGSRSVRPPSAFALFVGASAFALVAAASPALAQGKPAASKSDVKALSDGGQTGSGDTAGGVSVSEIVVTGSSIRGVPPTGSNLIQVGHDEVVNRGATTTQELLATIPQLGTFNQAPRPDPHSNGILSTAPNIRGIGQAQTLVLVNGHRLVGTGHLQNISDPSIIPPSALSRVEVLADGASSIYGSDGIAGVVNVITMKDYDGVEATVRYGLGDHYDRANSNLVFGKRWDTGGVVGSIEYSRNSRLEGFNRDWVRTDYRPLGGIDNRSLNDCVPAVFKLNNASGAATGDFIQYGTGAHNARCDISQYTDLYPAQNRLSLFAAGHQQLSDQVEVYFDAFHSKTNSDAFLSPAAASGVITRSSPFFPSSMVDPSVQSITAYYNVSAIDGVRLRDKQSIEVYGGTGGADVNLGPFKWSSYLTYSRSQTDLHEGSFSPVVNAAAIAGTTPSTALDPFTGLTSDAVKVGLADYEQFFGSKQRMFELNTKIDGPIYTLPGGEVKVAVGAVFRREFYDGVNTLSRIGFMENLGAQNASRTVYSGFGELFVPVFSADNARPGFQRLDVDVSGRYDNYSDFGSTFNPKVGVNWEPIDGYTLRATYSTSFHAPALPDLFGPDTRAGYSSGGLTPAGLAQRTGSIFIAGGNPDLDAEKAHSWSAGLDFQPPQIPNLRGSLTYYNIKFTGRIAFPSSSFFYVQPEFNRFFVDNVVCASGAYPTGTGCVSQPIDPNVVYNLIKGLRLQNFPKPVTSAADIPPIYIVSILRRQNLAEIDTDGLDFDVSYRIGAPWGWSMGAEFQGNYVFSYDQIAIPGAPSVSQFPFGQERFKARASLTATNGPVTAVATVNYDAPYKNQYLRPVGTSSVQAVETIDAFTSVDLHVGWDLPSFGPTSRNQVTLDVDNLFDAPPPPERAGNGYGVGDVLGRVVTVGFRTKF